MLRRALRLGAGAAALAAGGWTLRALHGAPAELGAAPEAIEAVTGRSPHCRGGVFHNLDRVSMPQLRREERGFVLRQLLFGRDTRRPSVPIPLRSAGLTGAASTVAISWLGHATALIEVDGFRVLTDPIWSARCSPSDLIGPERMHPPPVALDTLPALDAIVISHDHYDHLDMDTVAALGRAQRAPFVVPLGVGAHLRAWGIPADRVVELDWHERSAVGELSLVCTPARHFSGRFATRNRTLWSSWAIIGPRHRVYFGGDSGYTTGFREIGSEHGPFDATLMPIGAYSTAWPDVHMNPEEAVRAHLDVNGIDGTDGTDGADGAGGAGSSLLVPIHWCTFRLAPHPWAEPADRLVAAAGAAGVRVAVPRPGERVRPEAATPPEVWWRA